MVGEVETIDAVEGGIMCFRKSHYLMNGNSDAGCISLDGLLPILL